jgi:CTP:molybdopterin cytidylyltransferase MocA
MVEQVALPALTNVLAVLLAAGGGSRFAGPGHKLLAERDGRSVVEHAVASALHALGDVLVVTGAAELPRDVTAMGGVRVLHNARWAEGQATSLAAAIEFATGDRAGGVAAGGGIERTDRDRDIRRSASQPRTPPPLDLAAGSSHW